MAGGVGKAGIREEGFVLVDDVLAVAAALLAPATRTAAAASASLPVAMRRLKLWTRGSRQFLIDKVGTPRKKTAAL